MTMRRLAIMLCGFLAPASASAQGDGKPQEFMFPAALLANAPNWNVEKSDPSGEMTLTITGGARPTQFLFEGYFFLFPAGSDGKGLARVVVTDVGERSVTLKTSAEAARAFPEGASVRLVRPFNVTTAQMKAAPEFMALGDPKAGTGRADKDARAAAARARSVNNLKQIGLALHNYHAVHDHLPPAVVRGPDGKPWHSWRVLILPWMDQQGLYKEYDFSQPWDSEQNRKLVDRMPAVYRDPIYEEAKGGFAHYAVISGEGTPFAPEGVKMKRGGKGEGEIELEPEGLASFAMITDGLSNTVAVAPMSPERKVPWTKPEDIAFHEDFPALGDPKGIITPYESDGEKLTNVLLMDGAVKALSLKTNPAVVNALMTMRGGEVIAADVFNAGRGAAAQPGIVVNLTITIKDGKATATIR